MSKEDVGELTREELIEAVLKLQTIVEQLQHENEVLRKKLERLQKPPTNSRNSAQPPSLDRKGNRPGDKARKRHGPAKGHEKHERQFVEQPDQVVELKAQRCAHCQASLENEAGELLAVNQITELPPSPGEVIEVRQYAVTCPDCQQTILAQPRAGLEMGLLYPQAVLHVIRFNRSGEVIHEIMDQAQAEVWVSDCWVGQLKAPAKDRQLCLSHQLRNLQAVVDAYPSLTWPRALQVLFRYAIHLHHQRDQLPPDHFAAQVARIERHCDRLLLRQLAQPQAAKLQQRYRQYRQCLFVFLHRADVEPTNNVAEQALRHSMIHRKVMGSFRSHWGSQAFAALASVIDSAQLSGVAPFQAIFSLFDPPALPIPQTR